MSKKKSSKCFDVTMLMSAFGIGLHLASLVAGVVFFMVIKFNDLAHLEDGFNAFTSQYREDRVRTEIQINNLSNDVNKIKGHLNIDR